MDANGTSMRAARWHAALDVRVEDVPVPRPGPGDVLIRVERAGICGTDLEEYVAGPVSIPVGWPHPISGRQAPLILGHELVGTVEAGPMAGARVVPNVVVGCGRCWWCVRRQEMLCPKLGVRGLNDDGGFAEFIVAEADTCVPVPEYVDPDVAAFAEPVSVAIHALSKAEPLAGRVVAVNGAGVIGQLVVQLALAGGAVAVLAVDPVRVRRELARHWGAQACPPDEAPERMAALSGGRGADVVLECSGVRGALASTIELSRPGGTVVVVGIHAGTEQIPLLPLVLEERHLVGSAGHLWDVDVASAVALLSRGTLDVLPLRSAVVPLAKVVTDGFERLRTDKDVFKILVDPSPEGVDGAGDDQRDGHQ
ncbi:MAG TPA: zinc-binding dehydrogenase [Actinophytocola sp.]|uniref:zinc-binding dehydrogenase n=1 Tax=Actinophytocola sp. TaxID=1872138 RepID=UPI002DDD7076|nr:zinc-binding dehydrogenase [Actinophytocola sp.]HEV2778459.1 zinc-binding dehydrogenase [Actinophytocola sp.]